jgi:hypothetical protein
MSRRPLVTPRLKPGDVVVRRHRLLKTRGVVLRFDGEDENGASRAWIRWDHPTTLPNPSRETVDDLELAAGGEAAGPAPSPVSPDPPEDGQHPDR